MQLTAFGSDTFDEVVPVARVFGYYAVFFFFGVFLFQGRIAVRRWWAIALPPGNSYWFSGSLGAPARSRPVSRLQSRNNQGRFHFAENRLLVASVPRTDRAVPLGRLESAFLGGLLVCCVLLALSVPSAAGCCWADDRFGMASQRSPEIHIDTRGSPCPVAADLPDCCPQYRVGENPERSAYTSRNTVARTKFEQHWRAIVETTAQSQGRGNALWHM